MISPKTSIFNIQYTDIHGEQKDLSEYRGKKLMIVNVASECGYTYQYKNLQKLSESREDIVIIGFPSNQFGEQEPGDNTQIQNFCSSKYQVSFPMGSKTEVKGKGKSNLYAWLTESDKNGWNTQEPNWNFNKYIISEDGTLLGWFPSKIEPDNEQMLKLLDQK
ncbi:MAG TPA: glutathione peroxidase [Bacteroidia bacterium]|nr:glutathione peroxidase [Bacteroidia bacterium]HNT80104.1 glutathione peroxidase [Bacteroidia bacterium]